MAEDAERSVLAAELRHWQSAAHTLGDLEMIAAPAAWAALESYLERGVRATAEVAAEMAAALGLKSSVEGEIVVKAREIPRALRG